jgi:hypothetical protein
MSWTLIGLLVLWAPAVNAAAQEPREKKPVPVYTNEDLDRVAPHRDETGVNSQPAAPPPAERTAGRAAPSRRSAGAAESRLGGEEYWRRESDRLRLRLDRERSRIDSLRARIAAHESQPRSLSRRPTASRPEAELETWKSQLAALEAQVRETEARFEDRARREGALPGWLR